jgi:hypothetical protein
MDPQIIPRAERTAVGEPEPTLTLTQWHQLMADAAALERAQRPIYLHPSPQTATAAHGGVDIRVPSAPVVLATAKPKDRNPWPLVFMVSGCGALCSSVAAAVTDSPYAVLAVFATVAAWGVATYQLVFVREP